MAIFRRIFVTVTVGAGPSAEGIFFLITPEEFSLRGFAADIHEGRILIFVTHAVVITAALTEGIIFVAAGFIALDESVEADCADIASAIFDFKGICGFTGTLIAADEAGVVADRDFVIFINAGFTGVDVLCFGTISFDAGAVEPADFISLAVACNAFAGDAGQSGCTFHIFAAGIDGVVHADAIVANGFIIAANLF